MHPYFFFLFLFFFLFFFLLLSLVQTHHCNRHHEKKRFIDYIPEPIQEISKRTRRRTPNIPFQIQIIISKELKKDFPEVIPIITSTVEHVQHFLNLVDGPSFHQRLKKCGFPYYYDHDGDQNAFFDFQGQYAQFFHKASSDDEECTINTLAYSYNCEGSKNTKRPLTGLIVLCPAFFSSLNDLKHKKGTLDHELKHNLGFSDDHFLNYPISSRVHEHNNPKKNPFLKNYYINRGKTRLTATFREKCTKRTYQPIQKKNFFSWNQIPKKLKKYKSLMGHWLGLQDPTIWARNYFKCNQINGIILSPDKNHLSKLYYLDDYMTPVINESTNMDSIVVYLVIISSGWYTLRNEHELTKGHWFRDVGCGVFEQNCYDLWIEKRFGIQKKCRHFEKLSPRRMLKAPTWRFGIWYGFRGHRAKRGKCLDFPTPQNLDHFFCFDPKDPQCLIVEFEEEIDDPFYRYFANPRVGGIYGETIQYCGIWNNWRSRAVHYQREE